MTGRDARSDGLPPDLHRVREPVADVADMLLESETPPQHDELRRLPKVVLGLLIACSMLSMAVIGYGCAIGGGTRRPWLNASLAVLMAATLWTTIDLDHPRAGVIRLSDAPLEQLDLRPQPPKMQTSPPNS